MGGRGSLVKAGNTLIRSPGSLPVTLRASWNGMVLTDSERTVLVESKPYFPTPSPLARKIQDHVALRIGVAVEEVDGR